MQDMREGGYAYAAGGAELWCDSPNPPRRFENMLYNDVYFAQIDQTMCGVPEVGGRYMSGDGHICNVVFGERVVYVRDDRSGVLFSAGFAPVCRPYDRYRCCAGLNVQQVENVTDGLKVTWRLYIPVGADPLEVWDVRVENLTRRRRALSLVTELPMACDGVDLFGGFLYRRATFEPAHNAIYVQQDGEAHGRIDFPLHNGYITADRPAVSWCTNRDRFIGFTGTLADPEALREQRIPRHPADRYIPTGSLQVAFKVDPGAQADTRFLVGACDRPARVGRMRRKYLGGNLDHDPRFAAVVRDRRRVLANVSIRVPDQALEPKFNVWLKQQIHFGNVHCRWGYKGFRDIVQQAQGILAQDAPRARATLLKACAHQYADGFALRGWHPIDPMRYADSAQWLIGAISEYAKETGELEFLDVEVPFYDAGKATVYEHLRRALKRLRADRGAHGLCKIFFGDWNDSLTGVGRAGRGESVWLSMAFCRDCLLLAELAHRLGRPREARLMRRWQAEMVQAINQHAWDGNWYRCALDDDGRPIGSRRNRQGKLFLNMQSWAQLGGVCDDQRWARAWQSVRNHLDTGWGLKLNWPVYLTPEPNVGRMSYMRPGICENASVYTHGNAFMLMALLERGLADEALDLLRAIDPEHPGRPCLNQPNLYFNGYLGPDAITGAGQAEHVWCTGSAAWVYLAVTEHMLGLRRTFDGLVVKPCLPSAWKTAAITRTFRGTTYRVTLANPHGAANAPVVALTVDGRAHDPRHPLPLDGKTHGVAVTLGCGL